MSEGRFAILDPAAGISGDMLLGALIDAGAAPEWLTELPGRLGFSGTRIGIERTTRCGIACTRVSVVLESGETEPPLAEYSGHHAHHQAPEHRPNAATPHHGPHRHLGELLDIIDRAPISRRVRDQASAAFRLLAEAEGAVHGVAPEAVGLHEVGAVDAVIDIVGACEGFERLGVDRVYTRPLALGTGWVQAAHGVMSVPAPVTSVLVEGLEIGPNGPVVGEATTPTGAALIRVLASGKPPTHWRALGSGWGGGSRDPGQYPNALRLILAEPVAEAGEIIVLATDVDDLAPEYLEPLRQALMAAGALDVQVWPTHMKKGRTGFRIEAMADPARADGVTDAFFMHSTTAGVRRTPAERVTLARRELEVATAGGPVRVKVLELPGRLRLKPEFEDVSAAARQLGRPAHEVAREVQARAEALLAARPGDAARSGRGTTTEESR